mmetsp:Transcript_2694/g.5737  ORF Transcript_2694/g.5737 Transcript_2694/m.5737 type:complete len:82 (-) Transcript_2694:1150-1395(-)
MKPVAIIMVDRPKPVSANEVRCVVRSLTACGEDSKVPHPALKIRAPPAPSGIIERILSDCTVAKQCCPLNCSWTWNIHPET